MEVSEEQIEQLKKQVLDQINTTFPEDKKENAINQINSMNKEQFTEFLKQNKLIQTAQDQTSSQTPEAVQEMQESTQPQESPFRQIIRGDLPSYLIEEDNECMAVLEINPISKGHTIIIPKKPVYEVSEVPEECFSLAKKVSKRMKEKFKPKDIFMSSSSILGEIIINLLPQYGDENLGSQRTQAQPEELQAIQKELEYIPEPEIPKVKQEKITSSEENKIILPKRIP
jgi:histidine triad (HIT) family protein